MNVDPRGAPGGARLRTLFAVLRARVRAAGVVSVSVPSVALALASAPALPAAPALAVSLARAVVATPSLEPAPSPAPAPARVPSQDAVAGGGKTETPAVDTLGLERQRCRDLRMEGRLQEAFDCIRVLWNEHRGEMSAGGRIETMQMMAQLYCIARNWASARQCYEEILRIDGSWRPDDIDRYPASWREPIFAAYRAKGYLAGSPGLYNLALLDFHVVDLRKKDYDLETLATSLPNLVTALLEQNLNSRSIHTGEGEPRPIRVVSYHQRRLLLREIAVQGGLDPEGAVTAQALDQASLVKAGRLAAVQGFLEGSITRDPKDRVTVALRMFSVETGEVICSATAEGKAKDVVGVVEKVVERWASCATGGALQEWNAEHMGQLGSGSKAIAALQHYHNALKFADHEEIDRALEELALALAARPGFEPAEAALAAIHQQQANLSLTQALALPDAKGVVTP